MPVKIYIGNVNKDASREELETLFKQYGEITECSILTNFAFVVLISSIFLFRQNH